MSSQARIAQGKHVRDLLAIGLAGVHVTGSAGIAGVARQQLLRGELAAFIFGRGHESQRLGHHLLGVQEDEDLAQLLIGRIALLGEQRLQLLCQFQAHIGCRFAKAHQRQLPGPQELQLVLLVETVVVNRGQRFQDRRLVALVANTAQGNERLDATLHIGFHDRFLVPEVHRLLLDCHPGGVAHKPVWMRKVGPGLANRIGMTPIHVKLFKLTPQLHLLCGGKWTDLRRGLLAT